MTAIRVDYTSSQYVTRAGNPEDRWDRDDTAADNEIHGFKVVEGNKGYRDIDVPFDIDPEKIYYLVWADYGTGDSFGSDDNCVEFIDLFQTADKALEAKTALLQNVGGFSRKYTRDDGTEISVHIPWDGYFEHLNSLNIERVQVIL